MIGNLRSEHGTGVVHMEDVYDTELHDLWSAVSEPARLARWVADVSGELEVGGKFHAHFTSGWEGPGRVDVCDAPHRLLVTMSPGTDDQTVIEAVLTAAQGGTRLVVEERFLPLDELAAHGAGWQAHVEDLTAHLAGLPAADWRSRWVELTPAYRRLATELR